MTLIVYIETEEFELESTNDDDEDDETAADDETADDDDDDGNEDDCANGSIHKSPGAYNLTASSLNDLGQSMIDLSPSATASGNKSNDDDEHKNTNSNGSEEEEDDDDGVDDYVHNDDDNVHDDNVHTDNDNNNDGNDPVLLSSTHTIVTGGGDYRQSTICPITSSSSNKYRKRRVSDDDDDDDDDVNLKYGVESTTIRVSSSNRRRLTGNDGLRSIGKQVGSNRKGKVTFGSAQVVTSDDDCILTWTQGVNFCNFKFRAPGYNEIENNFALSSAPNSTLSKDPNNYVSVEACQVLYINVAAIIINAAPNPYRLLFYLKVTDSRLLTAKTRRFYEIIIFGKLCEFYKCKLSTNNGTPSIYDYDSGEVHHDSKSFEDHFNLILLKTNKGSFAKTPVGGDYIFCRTKINHQCTIARRHLNSLKK